MNSKFFPAVVVVILIGLSAGLLFAFTERAQEPRATAVEAPIPATPIAPAKPETPVAVPQVPPVASNPAAADTPEEKAAEDYALAGTDTPAPVAEVSTERRSFPEDGPSLFQKSDEIKAAGFEACFGGTGREPGQFAYPRALAWTDKGLYVVDKSGRIQLFDADGRLRFLVRTPLIDKGKPTGLAIDEKGRLLVADTHYARVLVYSPELELLSHYGSYGSESGQFLFVTDVCAAGGDRHFVTDYGDNVARVQMFDTDGVHKKSFGAYGTKEGQFQRPMALVTDEKRRELFVADAVNHRIQVFDFEGVFKRLIGGIGSEPGQLKYPYDVALDGDRLWIAEFGNNRLQVLHAQTGVHIATIGKAGRAAGEVAFPWGVALGPEDRFYFLDSGNNRIYMGSRSRLLGKERS